MYRDRYLYNADTVCKCTVTRSNPVTVKNRLIYHSNEPTENNYTKKKSLLREIQNLLRLIPFFSYTI